MHRPAIALSIALLLTAAATAEPVTHTTDDLHGWPVHVLDNGLVRLAVTPDIGGRVLMFRNLATGHDAAKLRRENIRKQPGDAWEGAEYGGFSDAATTGWPGAFWSVTYQAEPRDTPTGRAVRLTGRADGLEIRRTLALEPDSTLLRIDMRQRNVGDAPRKTNVRLHCEMAVGDKADNHDAIFWLGPDGLERHDIVVGAEHRRFRWLDVRGDWLALVDTAEGEAVIRRLLPTGQPKRVFYWAGYNEAPEINGDRGGFVGVDWFGEEKLLAPGQAIEAVEEMFLVRGLSRVDFVDGHVAGSLQTDRPRYGRSDTVTLTVSLAGATAIEPRDVTVNITGSDHKTLTRLTGRTPAAKPGQAATTELQWTWDDLPDGACRAELTVAGEDGQSIGRAVRTFIVDGELVRQATQRLGDFRQTVAALSQDLPDEPPLDVRTEAAVLDLRVRQLGELLDAGRYADLLERLPQARREAAALTERLKELSPADDAGTDKPSGPPPADAAPQVRHGTQTDRAATGNLLRNGSFETPDWFEPDQAEWWAKRPQTQRTTKAARTGEASLRIAGPKGGYTVQPDLALKAGTGYVLTAWVRRAGTAGRGVRLGYLDDTRQQWSDYGGGLDWRRVTLRLTTPEDPGVGAVRIDWDLEKGEVAWVDDVRLWPADGQVSQAPAPTISPDGGSSTGPVYVTLTSPLPRSVIRYTIDGSSPTPASKAYRTPFRVTGSVTVKARCFQAGYRPSKVAVASFTVRPHLAGGVPFTPTGYGRDVREFWADHPLNPGSPNAWSGPVDSPEPRINVAEVRNAHPESTTAGIAEALAQLPAGGGTLVFPKTDGPYVITAPARQTKNYYPLVAPVLVLRRSNVHFRSDGATIRYAPTKGIADDWPDDVLSMFTFSSMEYADAGTTQKPTRNFYFKGLTFDGGQAAPAAIFFRHCAEILFDDCTFTNFRQPRKGHPGLVSAATCTDNIWARNCTFAEGLNGIYYDGVHNAGFIGCSFGPKLAAHAVLLLTNNDMVKLQAAQRNTQYLVVADSTFRGPGRGCVTMTGANCLLTGNRVTGPYRHFLHQRGRGRSNIQPGMRYNGTGVCAIGNTVAGVKGFAYLDGDCTQHAWSTPLPFLFAENRATGLETILHLQPCKGATLDRGDYGVEKVRLEGNTFAGPKRPQIVIATPDVDRIANVVLEDNTISGEVRPLVVDAAGRPIDGADVTITGEATR